eukprot:1148321-Pelagomonas_calceolata.AAC.1
MGQGWKGKYGNGYKAGPAYDGVGMVLLQVHNRLPASEAHSMSIVPSTDIIYASCGTHQLTCLWSCGGRTSPSAMEAEGARLLCLRPPTLRAASGRLLCTPAKDWAALPEVRPRYTQHLDIRCASLSRTEEGYTMYLGAPWVVL